MLQIFKPAPHIDQIEDSEQIDATYKYWRIRILYSMFIGYAFYYFTRKSFVFAMPAMIEELGIEKGQLGILTSILSLSYGFSKFTSGIFADRSNPRYFMAIGLILTGFFNIFFGLSSSIVFFALFMGLNGWFQGFGWPPCARLLTHWYSQSERGTWWAIWNVSHNVGGALIPIIAALCAKYYGWRYAMYIPALMCIGVGFFLINRLRDTPQSLGLPRIEKWRNDYGGISAEKGDTERELTTREILFEHVLTNPYIWILGFSYFIVYIIRTGFNDWSALFLVEEKGYSKVFASSWVSLFEVGGFAGSLIAGWASDYIFSGKRGPTNVLYTMGVLASIIFFWMVPKGNTLFDSISLFMIGFMIFGPQMLIGIAAAELSHKKAAATATGFVGCFAYIGAATAGYPLAKIMEKWGWDGFFISMAVCALLATILLIPLWNAGPKSSFVKKKPKTEDTEPVVA